MMEKFALAGEGGECTPTPFHSVYHHVQSCSVRASWEGRHTPRISSLPLYVLCGSNQAGLRRARSLVHLLWPLFQPSPSLRSLKGVLACWVSILRITFSYAYGKTVYLSASFPKGRIHLQVDVRNWYILHLKFTIQKILSLICHSKQVLIDQADNFGPWRMFR